MDDLENNRAISLDAATQSEAPLLANLLELYIHDLSEIFPIEPGPEGRFGYPQLAHYWSEPDQRFPLLIRRRGRVVGFVLVTRGSVTGGDRRAWDVAEFFVLRRHRRSQIGRQAAVQLWNSRPGAWTVRVLERNVVGLAFWRGVIAEYTKGTAAESLRAGKPNNWRVFSFESVMPA